MIWMPVWQACAEVLKPKVVVLDSVQTLYSLSIDSVPWIDVTSSRSGKPIDGLTKRGRVRNRSPDSWRWLGWSRHEARCNR